MVLLVLLAVLLDRSPISLRMVAWAALAVLLIAPESLLGASFQMSFAAVTALVAGYEAIAGTGGPAGGGFGGAHCSEHFCRQRQIEQGVYQQCLVAVDDQAGVAPAPTTIRLQPGIAAVGELNLDVRFENNQQTFWQ